MEAEQPRVDPLVQRLAAPPLAPAAPRGLPVLGGVAVVWVRVGVYVCVCGRWVVYLI